MLYQMRHPLMAIIALLCVGAWWGWREYPQLFGRGPDDTQQLAQQAATSDVPGETLQETESGETGEAVTKAEQAPSPEIAVAEQPVSREPALSPEEAVVSRLLAAAEADLEARRLTSPSGNNAWENYQRVLELVPAHPEAVRGMERVIESYMQLFGAEVEKEAFDKAEGYLAKIGELHPDSPVLEEGQQRLQDAKQARANRLAEQERQRQAELERQRIADAIAEHWTAFETVLQAEDPDEAATILSQVRAMNPDEPGLTTGEQRLEALRTDLERQRAEAIQAHWSAFEAAIHAEDLDKATGILADIRSLNPEEPGLTTGEERLEAAQAELERKRREALKLELAGEMVSIPGGTFSMGDLSGEGDDDEKPVHSVTVSAFKLGKYEVTVGQFRRFVEATEYHTDAERNANGNDGCYTYTGDGWKWTWGRSWRNPGYSMEDDQPVTCVSWNDVQAFIAWLAVQTGESYRLPSEAEWEYAARAGSTTKYHFGNAGSRLCRYANHGDTSTDYSDRNRSCSDGIGERTAAVGRYEPNSYGLYDMHGNVWELVQDCFNGNYAEAPNDGRAWTRGDCSVRVIRGGSWGTSPDGLRSANRGRSRLTDRNTTRGFRLAQDQ